MSESVGNIFEKHPVLIGASVLGVALIAYLQSGKDQPTQQTVTFAGGGTARGIDPEASAIEQAAIAAGAANIGTLAQLLMLQDSNETALQGSLAQTYAARDTSLAATEADRQESLAATSAGLQASIARTEAERSASLAATEAAKVAELERIGATERVSVQSTRAQLEAARINAATQSEITRANQDAERAHAKNEEFAIQADKDKERARLNAGLAHGILDFGGKILAFFGL